MSVDGHVLGSATVGGAGGSAVAVLANTGNPILVGLIVGGAILVTLAFLARATQK